MVKSKLIQLLAIKLQALSTQNITQSVHVILEKMVSAMLRGERIEIRGFGTFSFHYQAPRTIYHPKTKKKFNTEAKYRIHFKPSKKLRERVNK